MTNTLCTKKGKNACSPRFKSGDIDSFRRKISSAYVLLAAAASITPLHRHPSIATRLCTHMVLDHGQHHA